MNFQELLNRMNELDMPVQETDKGDMDHDGKQEPDDQEYLDNKDAAIKKAMNKEVDECGLPGMDSMPGGMMGMRAEPPKQADNVNMNVSLNASGAGGIRDLMGILRNIESSEQGGEMEPPAPFGDMDKAVMVKKLPGFDSMMNAETFANEPDEMYGNMNSAIRDGGDLNRAKRSFARAQPGDNPMAVESIKNKLAALYEEVKNR